MVLRSNVHTHTNFSDGADTAEEMVLTALEKGFVSLGFSDHGYCDESSAMADEDLYCKEIRRLQRKYAGQIEIALGFEHEAFTHKNDFSLYDYVIESIHCLYRDGEPIVLDDTAEILQRGIERHYGGDPYAMCRDYFDQVCRSMMETRADIVGHIGLISKFNEKKPLFDHLDKRYLDYASQTIALAAEKDILVEINSGAMSRGYRSTPYPYFEQLKLLKELGGRIIITTDCHRAQWLDHGMDVSLALAKKAGFQEGWIWLDGSFRPQGL